MKSPVIKRSILLGGHKTSVSLEEAFWQGLKEIANRRDMSVSALIGTIDNRRAEGNLSSCIRLFVLDHFRTLASAQPTDPGPTGRPDDIRGGNVGGRDVSLRHRDHATCVSQVGVTSGSVSLTTRLRPVRLAT